MRIFKLLLFGLKLLIRKKEVVFWNIVFPPMLLIIVGIFTMKSNLMDGKYMEFFTPGLVGYSIMQGSLTGAPSRVVQYSQNGVLSRIFLTPCSISGFIMLEFAATSLIICFQVAVLTILSTFIFDINVKSFVFFICGTILGLIFFQLLGMVIANLCRTTEGVDAFANCISFPMLIFSGVFFPATILPAGEKVSYFLPLTQVLNLMRGNPRGNSSIIIMLIWIVISIIGVAFTIRIQRK